MKMLVDSLNLSKARCEMIRITKIHSRSSIGAKQLPVMFWLALNINSVNKFFLSNNYNFIKIVCNSRELRVFNLVRGGV